MMNFQFTHASKVFRRPDFGHWVYGTVIDLIAVGNQGQTINEKLLNYIKINTKNLEIELS